MLAPKRATSANKQPVKHVYIRSLETLQQVPLLSDAKSPGTTISAEALFVDASTGADSIVLPRPLL